MIRARPSHRSPYPLDQLEKCRPFRTHSIDNALGLRGALCNTQTRQVIDMNGSHSVPSVSTHREQRRVS